MIELGKTQTLKVNRKASIGLFLGDGLNEEILLPNRYVPEGTGPGDELEVFVYNDSEDRPIATTEKPLAEAGQFAFLQAKSVSGFGAFMDWGLPKDLLVPHRQQAGRMKPGEFYLVYIMRDEITDRLLASTKWEKFLQEDVSALQEGDEVSLLIAEETDLGFKAIINQTFGGLIYHNELFQPLFPGSKAIGYIKKIREDGKVDVSLQKQGFENIGTSVQQLLQALESSGGFLALTDKSEPEEIYARLQMSKKTFKKALGTLYKQRLVELSATGIKYLGE